MAKLLIRASELKLWHFEVFPYVCVVDCPLYRQTIHWQCFLPTCYVNGCGHAHRWTWPLLICSKMQYREPGCIVWFYYACSFTPGAILSTAKLGIGSGDKAMNLAVLCGDFRTFFFCLVCRSLVWYGLQQVELELSIKKKANKYAIKTADRGWASWTDYLYSSHKHGDFGGLVWSSDYVWLIIETVPTAGGWSDSKIHTTLIATVRLAESDKYGRPHEHTEVSNAYTRVSLQVACGRAHIHGYTDVRLCAARGSPAEDVYLPLTCTVSAWHHGLSTLC